MRAEANLLSQRGASNHHNALTAGQLGLDHTLHSFSEQASDPYTLAAVFAGGTAFRAVRGLGLGTLGGAAAESRIASALLRAGSNAAGLVAESGTFVTSDRLLRVAFGKADRSVLEWSGQNGLKNAWASATVNFGALRAGGALTAGQGALVQHLGAVNAMVAANQASAALGFTEAPQDSLVQQFVNASILDLQMKAGMSLLHHFAPGLARWERGVDAALEARSESLPSLFGGERGLSLGARGAELLLMGSEGSAERGSELARSEGESPALSPKRAAQLAKAVRALNGKIRNYLEICSDPRIAEHTESIRAELNAELQNTAVSEASVQGKRDLLARSVSRFQELLSNPALKDKPFLTLRHLIPNGMTVAASLMAVVGLNVFISAAHLEPLHFYLASAALATAVALDKADGFVARKMGATHKVGGFLDSFADSWNYGLFSAVFTFAAMHASGNDLGGWLSSLTIGMSGVLRLSTFEYLGSEDGRSQMPHVDKLGNPVLGNGEDFIGRPSTLMGFIIPTLYFTFGRSNPELFGTLATLAGANMYSPLRYPKLTDGILGDLFRNWKVLVPAIAGLSAASVYLTGDARFVQTPVWLALAGYEASPFIQWAMRRRSRTREARVVAPLSLPSETGNGLGNSGDGNQHGSEAPRIGE